MCSKPVVPAKAGTPHLNRPRRGKVDSGFRRDDEVTIEASAAPVPIIDQRRLLHRPLELPQGRVAPLHRIVERLLRRRLAGEGVFDILGDDVTDLQEVAEAEPP